MRDGRILWGLISGLVLLVIGAVLYGCLKFGYEPEWGMVAVAAGMVIPVILWRWPIVMFPGLLFIGEYKTVAAQGISLTDPTMLMFLLCWAAIIIDWLRESFSGPSKSSQVPIFAGQTFKISLFLLFAAALAVTFLYTPAEAYGRTKLLRFLTFETVVFFGPILLLKDENALRPMLWSMIVLSLPLLVKQLVRIAHPSQQVLLGDIDVTEIGPGVDFGTSLLIAMYTRLIRSPWVMFSVVVLMSVGIVTSAARTPVLALILTLIISTSLRLGRVSRTLSLKRILGICCLSAVVAALALSSVSDRPGMHNKLAAKETEIAALITGSHYEHGTVKTRFAFYNSALRAIAEHPFTGLGLGGWSHFYSGPQVEGVPRPFYPHNFLLEVGSEQGLLGLAVLLVLLTSLFQSARKAGRYPEFAFLAPVLIFQVLNHIFTGSIEDRGLWFWCGTVVAISQMVHSRERADHPPRFKIFSKPASNAASRSQAQLGSAAPKQPHRKMVTLRTPFRA